MAQNIVASARVKRQQSEQAEPTHEALVAQFRAELANRRSPLDEIAPAEREQARKEFRHLPEVAGKPLPAPGRRRGSSKKIVQFTPQS